MRLSTHLSALRARAGRLRESSRAATAVEYGLIAALIVLAMIASFKEVANGTVGMWTNTQTKIGNATGY